MRLGLVTGWVELRKPPSRGQIRSFTTSSTEVTYG